MSTDSDDDLEENALDEKYDFQAPPLEDQGLFNYQTVWSEQLFKQIELGCHRFNKYIMSPTKIKNEEISIFKKDWIQQAIKLIPAHLLQKYSSCAKT